MSKDHSVPSLPEKEGEADLGRRRAVKRIGVAAGAVYVAPTLLPLTGALAQESSSSSSSEGGPGWAKPSKPTKPSKPDQPDK